MALARCSQPTVLPRLLKLLATTVVCGLIVGCASHNRPGEPIVDLQGTDPVLYSQDLAECRTYASEVAVG
ncbi:MAG: hypothetical protein AB8B93_19005, partial [Pseudomonadales bacterium]